MPNSQWETIKRLFHDALDQPANKRAAHLDAACADVPELRGEIERLLEQHDQAHEFLETPALASAGSDIVTEMSIAGVRIGSYTLEAAIGEGGMSTVYRAVQDGTNRSVALKILRSGMASREVLRRFQQESRLLGRLQHPGIAQILEAGISTTEHGDCPFFAMELIEGLPVTRYAESHSLSTRERLQLLARIADAVHHAHLKGIVHRDIKPDNILVDSSGQPKVLDFGVARATNSDVRVTTLHTDIGKLIGTIPYMSPEQVAGDSREIDARSDVYALGVVGYELLTGRLPYDLSNKPIPEAIRIIGRDDPTPLSAVSRTFRGDIETILGKALEKDRTLRYQSAAELAGDIHRHLHNEPLVARPASTLYQLRKFTSRNKALVGGVVLVFAALMAGFMGTTWQWLRAEEQLRTANEVNLLLHDLLESPFVCEHGRDVTVLELLEDTAHQLEARFPDKPEIKGQSIWRSEILISKSEWSTSQRTTCEPHCAVSLRPMERSIGRLWLPWRGWPCCSTGRASLRRRSGWDGRPVSSRNAFWGWSICLHTQTQELLQRAWRHAGCVGHRFDALAVQVRELPGDIDIQVPAGRPPAKAAVKRVQKRGQRGFDLQNPCGIHAKILLCSRSTHRNLGHDRRICRAFVAL